MLHTIAVLTPTLDCVPAAMMLVDARGRIAHANPHAERTLAAPARSLAGRSIDQLVPLRFRGAHPGNRQGFLDDPRARPMGAGRELYALRDDGVEIPVEIGLNPLETEQGSMVLAVVVDVSERRDREESLRRALEEKELLLGEVHHRVKNNLQVIHSLLDLQAMRMKDPRAKEMLRDSQNRVRSMALIHQTLYQSHDFARVDFTHFLETLAPALVESYAVSDRIALRARGAPISLPLGAAIPCGLIVNELVSNAIKHGFPGGGAGTIDVSIRAAPEGDFILEVTNDGVPMPAAAGSEPAESLGLVLVNMLTEQLHGALELRRAGPVRFTVRFPGARP